MAKLSAYAPEKEARRLGGLEGEIWVGPGFDDEDPVVLRMFGGEP